MKKEDKFMKWVGIIFIIIGGLVILSAIPGIQMSTISIGPIEVSDVDQLDATRIVVGVVLVFLGHTAYKRR